MTDPRAPQSAPAAPPPKPAPPFFQASIKAMIERQGSDLLLKVGRPPTVRIAGELQSLELSPLSPQDLKALAEYTMPGRQLKEFAETKEADFALGVPGIGRQFINSATGRDYPLLLGIVLVFGALIVLMNLLVDISYGFLDPRIRYQ